jgi:hypothetical protein
MAPFLLMLLLSQIDPCSESHRVDESPGTYGWPVQGLEETLQPLREALLGS